MGEVLGTCGEGRQLQHSDEGQAGSGAPAICAAAQAQAGVCVEVWGCVPLSFLLSFQLPTLHLGGTAGGQLVLGGSNTLLGCRLLSKAHNVAELELLNLRSPCLC